MADPTKYTPGYDFSNYQAVTPNKPLPGDRVDIELADIAQSIDETVEALKDIRRADGALQNGIVTLDALGPSVASSLAADVLVALGPQAEEAVREALPEWRGAWQTARAYAVNDLAREAGSTYICVVAHTSGTFSADLIAGRWDMFAQQGTGDMLRSNNLSDLNNTATARSNLGVAAASDTLLKVDNLSGLADTATARSNLGLTIPASVINRGPDPENRIINGAFDFWQRGTSHSTNSYGSADRWFNGASGGTVTQSRQSHTAGHTFGANNPAFFLRQTVSGQTLSSHFAATLQRIEGVRTYAGQTVTILGWARRSSGSGNMAVEMEQSFGTGGSPSAAVSGVGVTMVTLSGTWQPFAVTVSVPSITGKTLGSNGDDFLAVNFWTSAGSNFNARTNSLGLQTIGVDLWGVHVRLGTHTTAACDAYRAPEVGPELARCQRYYCTVNANARFWASAAGQIADASVYWPVTMRVAPAAARSGSSTNTSAVTINNADTQGLRFSIISAAAGDCFAIINVITADAEL